MSDFNLNGVRLLPSRFVSLAAISIASEATLVTPTAGKRFVLLGGLISLTGAAGNVSLKDGNSGSTLFTIPNVLVGTPFEFSIPGGLTFGQDNLLRAIGVASQVINGTLWGIEI